jgi:hypothetical protein
LRVAFFAKDFLTTDFSGTFAPFSRASDKPIAMAYLRLFTVLPDLPLFSAPSFFLCIAFSTLSCAVFEYFAIIQKLIRVKIYTKVYLNYPRYTLSSYLTLKKCYFFYKNG